MADRDDPTIDASRPVKSKKAGSRRAEPVQRLTLKALNMAAAVVNCDPDELLRSLNVVVELAPGVLVEPDRLRWHPMLGKFVYRSPNGGIAELERLQRALKFGYNDGTCATSSNRGPFSGQDFDKGLDPACWHETSMLVTGDAAPYVRVQRLVVELGTMLFAYEVVDRTQIPHVSTNRWVARSHSGDFRLVDMRHGCEPNFDSLAAVIAAADAAVLGEGPYFRWIPTDLPRDLIRLLERRDGRHD